MRGTIETHFLRWRSSGDPGDLGVVFDACTPRLLALALHLVGDPADAEDLLQATFLAAIEDAGRFEEGRLLLPWLSGILTHRVRRHHRRRAQKREQSLEGLVDRPDEQVSRDADGSEDVVETIERKIEQVGDPYRPVLLLSLIHGLRPAEVARVLGRTPGSVRVQLHRGLEQLRQRLPRGLNLSAMAPMWISMRPERGLAAIRESVLARGVLTKSTLVSTGTLGALAMGKKSLAAAAIALAAILTALGPWTWSRFGAEPATPDSGDIHGIELTSTSEDPNPKGMAAAQRTPIESHGTGIATQPGSRLTGRVLDGLTWKPIAGARIEAFPTRRTTLRQLKRDHPLVLPERLRDGVVMLPLGATPRTREGFRIAPDLPVQAWGAPRRDQTPESFTKSSESGRFSLASSVDPATLRVSYPKYEPVLVPADSQAEDNIVLLYPGRVLRSRVVMDDGRTPPDTVHIVFYGAPGHSQRDRLPDHQMWDRSGPWIGTAEAHEGTFELRIGASVVYGQCRTPGYALTGYRDLEKEPVIHVTERRLELTDRGRHVEFVVERVPTLEVIDAETRAPINEFGMIVRQQVGDRLLIAGQYTLLDGAMSLWERRGGPTETLEGPLHFQVWAEGYVEARVEVEELSAETPLRIQLQSGEGASARARVTRNGTPVAGSHVSLEQTIPGLGSTFRHRRVDQATTGADGTATVQAPPGEYIVRARKGEAEVAALMTLEAGSMSSVELDLDELVHLRLRVRDTQNQVRSDLITVLNLEDGRLVEFELDAEGQAEFAGIQPGTHRLIVSTFSDQGAIHWVANEEIVVHPGRSREIPVEVPPRRVIHPRLVVEHHDGDFTGWEYRDEWLDDETPWAVVPDNGVLPVDVSQGGILGVREPAGQRWEAQIISNPEDDPQIHLSLSDIGYRGTLETGGAVESLESLELWATSTAEDDWRVHHAMIDRDGSFRIRGLPSGEFELSFGGSDDVRYQKFYPQERPSPTSTPLRLRLHKLEGDRFAGHGVMAWNSVVTDEADGTPIPGARAWARALLDVGEGTWHLFPPTSYALSADDGTFRVEVPRGTRYRMTVSYEPGGNYASVRRRTVVRSGAGLGSSTEGTWEVTLPE